MTPHLPVQSDGGLTPYYDDGTVTIYHGDCREIVPTLGRFDLLLTDPPYGIGVDRAMAKSGGTKYGRAAAEKRRYEADGWDDAPPPAWVVAMLREVTTHQIIWGGNYFGLPAARGWLVWDKQVNGEFADCELAWTSLDIPVRRKEHMWNGMLRKGHEARYHPTQKPLPVMLWCLQLAGEHAQTILDPFAGSGTTGRAAKDLGRRAVLIEQDERYCRIAADRMAQDVLDFGEAA